MPSWCAGLWDRVWREVVGEDPGVVEQQLPIVPLPCHILVRPYTGATRLAPGQPSVKQSPNTFL